MAERQDESDEVLGVYAPRCPDCGWQSIARPYSESDRDGVYVLAREDVVAHRDACCWADPIHHRHQWDEIAVCNESGRPLAWRCRWCVREVIEIPTPPADGGSAS